MFYCFSERRQLCEPADVQGAFSATAKAIYLDVLSMLRVGRSGRNTALSERSLVNMSFGHLGQLTPAVQLGAESKWLCSSPWSVELVRSLKRFQLTCRFLVLNETRIEAERARTAALWYPGDQLNFYPCLRVREDGAEGRTSRRILLEKLGVGRVKRRLLCFHVREKGGHFDHVVER